MKRSAGVGIALAVLAITAQGASPDKSSRSMNQKLDELAKVLHRRLTDQLRDAESARFRNEFLSRPTDTSENGLALCGEVNSKNAYGGYTGFAPYVVAPDGYVMMNAQGSVSDDAWPGVLATWCVNRVR